MTQDLSSIAQLYSENLKTFGASPKSVGWRDDETHLLRFEKLAYLIQADLSAGRDPNYTVADLGCGYGAMYDYLKNHISGNMVHFTGYDISPEMLEAAKAAYTQGDADFLPNARLIQPVDYAFVSGIFNVRFEETEERWEAYVKEVLNNLNEHTTRGFAFNVLTSYVDYREGHLYYADPLRYFDYCKQNFSKKVTLLHDYPLYEWTMVVLK